MLAIEDRANDCRRQIRETYEHGQIIALQSEPNRHAVVTARKEQDFHGEKRSNETRASTTDPDARLYRKGPGKEAKLCVIGHALMENRNALFVDACLTQADGRAERIAALHMIEVRADRPRSITLGADKAYDAEDFVNELRATKVTPHVAQNTRGRASAIDARTTRHAGYAISQRIRKKIEEGIVTFVKNRRLSSQFGPSMSAVTP